MNRAALIAVAALLAAGCGEDNSSDSANSPKQPAAAKPEKAEMACARPSKAAVRSLQDSLKRPGRLRNAQAVKSDDETTIPGLARNGLYYLAAQLGDRVLIWGVGGDFLKDGGGLAIAVDDTTRQSSKAGDLVDAEKIGLSTGSKDVTTALICARGETK